MGSSGQNRCVSAPVPLTLFRPLPVQVLLRSGVTGVEREHFSQLVLSQFRKVFCEVDLREPEVGIGVSGQVIDEDRIPDLGDRLPLLQPPVPSRVREVDPLQVHS
jgi:hypothetical protein